ncbi:hypothetical protein EG328_003222 [Venturia inaequalis]|uniref:DNA-directed RNA polymerase I subunit RPA12 n=1 Tax=Venturia inaequalis TaxID=5025 RepID=A0A8H3YXD5_VENIN|nr:hypothetical protein EG328_003222 [Venturia inaequalis]
MAAIGSLVFCQSCGNLLDSANGDDSVVLTCDVCGAKCKGMLKKSVTFFFPYIQELGDYGNTRHRGGHGLLPLESNSWDMSRRQRPSNIPETVSMLNRLPPGSSSRAVSLPGSYTSSTLITTTSKPSSFPSKLRDKLSGDVQQINVEDYSTEREFEITCPNACGAEKARYHEKQTRGADEGSTIFYTCVGCGFKWNTNN